MGPQSPFGYAMLGPACDGMARDYDASTWKKLTTGRSYATQGRVPPSFERIHGPARRSRDFLMDFHSTSPLRCRPRSSTRASCEPTHCPLSRMALYAPQIHIAFTPWLVNCTVHSEV